MAGVVLVTCLSLAAAKSYSSSRTNEPPNNYNFEHYNESENELPFDPQSWAKQVEAEVSKNYYGIIKGTYLDEYASDPSNFPKVSSPGIPDKVLMVVDELEQESSQAKRTLNKEVEVMKRILKVVKEAKETANLANAKVISLKNSLEVAKANAYQDSEKASKAAAEHAKRSDMVLAAKRYKDALERYLYSAVYPAKTK